MAKRITKVKATVETKGTKSTGVDAALSAQAEVGSTPAVPATPEVIVEPSDEHGRLFDEIDESDTPVIVNPAFLSKRPDDGIAIDADLTPDERDEFIKMINLALPLSERAILLAKLAHMTDTKRAPVALRAIQEANALTRISGDHVGGSAPLFQLPKDTTVSVKIERVEK